MSSLSDSGFQTLLGYYLPRGGGVVSDPTSTPPQSGFGDSHAWWHNSQGTVMMHMKLCQHDYVLDSTLSAPQTETHLIFKATL